MALRKEVNFGCPIEGCGSPYLDWHHFDPPWSEREHHEPGGMIALCPTHHRQADAGAYTKEQLHHFKRNPYLKSSEGLKGRFEWKREDLLVCAGGNWFVKPSFIIRSTDVDMVWLTKDSDGHELLNMSIRNCSGEEAFAMSRNDWTVISKLDDVECSPGGKRLELRRPDQNVQLSISFKNANRDDIKSMLFEQEEWMRRNVSRYSETVSDESVDQTVSRVLEKILLPLHGRGFALCEIYADLDWPCKVLIDKRRILIKGTSSETEFTGSWCVGVGLTVDALGLASVSVLPETIVQEPDEIPYWVCGACGHLNGFPIAWEKNGLKGERARISAVCQACKRRSSISPGDVQWTKSSLIGDSVAEWTVRGAPPGRIQQLQSAWCDHDGSADLLDSLYSHREHCSTRKR